eukprot:977448-Prorocentrum_minimum.AAC.3
MRASTHSRPKYCGMRAFSALPSRRPVQQWCATDTLCSYFTHRSQQLHTPLTAASQTARSSFTHRSQQLHMPLTAASHTAHSSFTRCSQHASTPHVHIYTSSSRLNS